MKLYRSTPRTRLGRPAESRKHTSGCRVFLLRERGVHCDENGQNQNSMAERFWHLNQLTTQGLTLRPLLHLLRLQDDGAVEREISRARIAVMEAALDSLDGDRSRAGTMMREQYAAARKVAEDHYERKRRPNMTSCGCARSLPSVKRCTTCAREARLATKPFAASRKSSTGPS
jgi:hypothetical protein